MVADDERRDDAPADEQRVEEQPAEEQPAEQAPADEQPAEPAPTGEEPAEERAEPAPTAEEPAEEAPAGQPAAEQEGEPAEDEKTAAPKDVPPGAELEPIAIEEDRELSAEERAKREAEAEERAKREAEATAEAGEEPTARAAPTVALEGDVRVRATGKRKSSVARVMLVPGSGGFEVNRRQLDEYFPRPLHQTMARQPLVTTGYEENVDVRVRVHGGGISGQAGAVRHGVARALCEIDPELRKELKRRGLLTRDAREKERRKAGLKKARKRPQFSKR
jgi:small subunit ribosomal protein S9